MRICFFGVQADKVADVTVSEFVEIWRRSPFVGRADKNLRSAQFRCHDQVMRDHQTKLGEFFSAALLKRDFHREIDAMVVSENTKSEANLFDIVSESHPF